MAAGFHMRVLRLLYGTSLFRNTNRARGFRLLREWLSPQQRAQFDAEAQFEVIGSDTGKRYRIRHRTSTIVYEIDALGRHGTGWCFLPAGGLVPEDVMLAQKIALETNESAVLAIANKFAA